MDLLFLHSKKMHVNREMGIWIFTWWPAKLKCVRDQRINWQEGTSQDGWHFYKQMEGGKHTLQSNYSLLLCLVELGVIDCCCRFSVFVSERNSSGACCVVHSARDDSHIVVNKAHTFPTPSSDTHELSAHHFLFLYGKMPSIPPPSLSLSLSLSLYLCVHPSPLCRL
jgi:hypothetical protein